MEFVVIIIVLGILSILGTIVFWGAVGTAIYKLFRSQEGVSGPLGGGFGMDADLVLAMQQMQTLIAEAQGWANEHGSGQIPPALQSQWLAQLLDTQTQMSHLNALDRQRHDLSVSGMLSSASAAGLDVSSWNTSRW